MRRSGRVRNPLSAGVFLHLIYIYACITVSTSIDYGVPIEIKVWDTGRSPLAHMVDVTNEFGLKVLAEHNFLNDNNIAFSPYGLMGIMVALFEGVDGESSYQIQRGMQLPWNRNVMRIGFRDIHRTLKTYFVPEEGFLAGLALNNDNVTFNESYKKILRFYGFDLENDQLPTTTNTTPTNTSSTNSNGSPVDSTTPAMTTENKPAQENTSTISTKEETTTNPNAETISDVDIQKPTDMSTISPSSAPNAESTTTSSPVTTTGQVTTSEINTETTVKTSATSMMPITTPTASTTNTPPISAASNTRSTSTVLDTPSTSTPSSPASSSPSSTISLIETTVTIPTTTVPPSIATDAETVAQQTSQASSTLADVLTTNSEVINLSTLDMGSSTTESNTPELSANTLSTITTSNTETESVMTTSMSQTETIATSTTIADTPTLTESTTLETLQRRKKSIVDFIFTHPPYIEDFLLHRSFDVGAELPDSGFDDKMFLANGLRSVHVAYMHYDTVLEHAFLPHLEASALRLPLDSDRYYLLVVLPMRGGAAELGRLLARMARESDLSDVYAALRPRRVKAVVPSFTVKGHVALTTDLQKLGIHDVFEPRQRDFTLMTPQTGVYVRSIEQAVSVAIRKYQPDDQKKNRYVKNRKPVIFSATYPFLYFVMDASIHVSLMAGKMVDPLNSRIL